MISHFCHKRYAITRTQMTGILCWTARLQKSKSMESMTLTAYLIDPLLASENLRVSGLSSFMTPTGLIRIRSHHITSPHFMKKTEAGHKGLCIREIVTNTIMILPIHKILHDCTAVSDAMEICFIIVQYVLIRPEFI